MDEIEERKEVIFQLKDEVFSLLFDNAGKIDGKVKDGIKDLVTETDAEIEKIIVDRISKHFPQDTIIGEEFGTSKKGNNGFSWYIDPIDGTNNFIIGLPEYGTSVGLVHNGEIVLGIVFYADKKVYWAIKDQGAFVDDLPLKVSNRTKTEELTIALQFHYDPELVKKDFANLLTFYNDIRGFRLTGSCVGPMIMVAKGIYDASWGQEYCDPHDFVACALIVKEAGGFVSDLNPDHFIKPVKGHVIATNGKAHKQIVSMLIDNYEKS